MSAFSLSFVPSVHNGNTASTFKTPAASYASHAHVRDFAPPLCRCLALGFCSIAVFGPLQSVMAETMKQPNDETLVFTHTPHHPSAISTEDSATEAPDLKAANTLPVEEKRGAAERAHSPSREDFFSAEEGHRLFEKNVVLNLEGCEEFSICVSSNAFFRKNALLQTSASSMGEQPVPILDFARVISPARAGSLLSDIYTLEAETGWRLRVITKSGSSATISGKDLKDLWKPDDKTVIVIEDLSSPNILNFNAGSEVMAKLPRQFFLELQSRYGNRFYVQQEGEGAALMSTVQAIQECLGRPGGCKNVPGLTNDLYYLTLATSIVGGCVFGFAARLPPTGRVGASWQWVVFLFPLWLLLFVSFGILPILGRTSELEPLLKNTLGFSAGAIALYLTPIFGPSPISKR